MNIIEVNWWKGDVRCWLADFLRVRSIASSRPIALASVFGPRSRIEEVTSTHNVIFFSGEQLNVGRYEEYGDYCLGMPELRASLGFVNSSDLRALRFPLWLMYMFSPDSTPEEINRRVEQLSFPLKGKLDWMPRWRFAALIARHDRGGTRRQIMADLSGVGKVSCGGKLCHNSRSLKWIFRDDKMAYLRGFRFNICPENVNANGYVTEKLFQCIEAGCIPIYWGAGQCPEPDVLNQDAILFWDKCSDSRQRLVNCVRGLMSSQARFRAFQRQPRLSERAGDAAQAYFQDLENHLRRVLA